MAVATLCSSICFWLHRRFSRFEVAGGGIIIELVHFREDVNTFVGAIQQALRRYISMYRRQPGLPQPVKAERLTFRSLTMQHLACLALQTLRTAFSALKRVKPTTDADSFGLVLCVPRH